MKRSISMFLVLLSGILLSGCIPNQPYRTYQANDCNISSQHSCIIEKGEGYEMGFVEFSDRGNRFSDVQKDMVLAKAKEYIDNNGTVIVFVHGWHHNADAKDKNVNKMQEGLEKISKYIRHDSKVFGIYVGWRGESYRFLKSEELSFWERKAVAEEVGKGGVSEFFLDLEQIRNNTKATNPKLVIVGHSFGGAIVLSALEHSLIGKIKDKKTHPTNPLHTFGDAVVLLNPAIEATQIMPLMDASQEVATTERNSTLLYVISSTGDTATHLYFPIGQRLDVGMTWDHKKISRSYMSPSQTLDEYEMDITTVGNFKPFHTGNILTDQHLDKKAMIPFEDGEKFGRWRYQNCCGEKLNNCSLSKDTATHMQCDENFPLSFIYTDTQFIEEHNDVFNNALIAFISAAVSSQPEKSFSDVFTSFYKKLENKK